MATPVERPSVAPDSQLDRSQSFLQQLLEGIKGAGPPTILQDPPKPKVTTRTPPARVGSRRESSVWVGGTSIAQEAREKLREADQARALKAIDTASQGDANSRRASLRIVTAGLNDLSSSSDGNTTESSLYDTQDNAENHPSRFTFLGKAEAPHQRATVGGLRLPGSVAFSAQSFEALDDAFAPDSPPMFCDVESDLTVTPSPTEAPTSATSTALTDATTVTDGGSGTPSDSGSISPGKRTHSPPISPQPRLKKARTMSISGKAGDYQPFARRRSTFNERAHASLQLNTPIATGMLPELSSFRPGPAGPQGVPLVSKTPPRPSTRRSSLAPLDSTPTAAETPSYMRPFDLVDYGDMSLYEQLHGSECEDYPLCLHCFEQHGYFKRILVFGYELCGGSETLESDYWETNGIFDEGGAGWGGWWKTGR